MTNTFEEKRAAVRQLLADDGVSHTLRERVDAVLAGECADAARYRWLRDQATSILTSRPGGFWKFTVLAPGVVVSPLENDDLSELDMLIDAARAAGPTPEQERALQAMADDAQALGMYDDQAGGK